MLKKILSKFVDPNLIPQILKYLVVGTSSAFFEILIFYVLLNIIKVNLLISNTIAYTIIFCYNYILQRTWAFKSSSNVSKQIIQYGILFCFNLFVSNALIVVFYQKLNIHEIIAKMMTIGVVVSWNFIIYKKIIFRK
jgi:putative flippase GtrA